MTSTLLVPAGSHVRAMDLGNSRAASRPLHAIGFVSTGFAVSQECWAIFCSPENSKVVSVWTALVLDVRNAGSVDCAFELVSAHNPRGSRPATRADGAAMRSAIISGEVACYLMPKLPCLDRQIPSLVE